MTTAMHDHGRQFQPGAGVNAGLRSLPLSDWALVVDADIVLPGTVHQTIQNLGWNARSCYGIDRVHCRGWHAWRRFVSTPRMIQTCEVPFLRDFPAGAESACPATATCRAGSFSSGTPAQPDTAITRFDPNGTAEGSDMLHSARFPRQYRELIPEIVGIQLETDTATDPVGVNWAGRRTAEFSQNGGPYRR